MREKEKKNPCKAHNKIRLFHQRHDEKNGIYKNRPVARNWGQGLYVYIARCDSEAELRNGLQVPKGRPY